MTSATQLDLTRHILSLAPHNAPQSSSEPLYTPLNDSRNEIRLLEIAQCSNCDRSLKLFKCSLDDVPQYFALSYVWGDPEDTRPIRVNNWDVQVTLNLVDALHQLQDDGRVQYLWVDALCINQRDDQEKSKQVQKMGNIFSAAIQVAGWLGYEEAVSRKAMQSLGRMARIADSLHIRNSFNVDSSPHHVRDQVLSNILHILGTDLEAWDSAIESILHFLQNPYWKRVWIIQEVNLATSAVLLCGPDHILWDDVAAAMHILAYINYAVTKVLIKEDWPALIALFRPMRPQHIRFPAAMKLHASFTALGRNGVPLIGLVEATCNNRNLHCAIPHDRVYSLLGLMTAEDRQSFKVDYSLPYDELCIQTTVRLLKQHGPSVLMYCVPREQASHGTLPSWAVDWTSTEMRAQALHSKTLMLTKRYHLHCHGPHQIGVTATIITAVIWTTAYSGGPEDLARVVNAVAGQMSTRRGVEEALSLGEVRRPTIRTVLYDPCGNRPIEQTRVGLLEEMLFGTTEAGFLRHHKWEEEHGCNQKADPETVVYDKDALAQLLWNTCPRSLYITEHGSIGSGPPSTQVGDVLCAFAECPFPFLIRPCQCKNNNAHWEVVGPSWVDDMITWEPENAPFEFTLRDFWKTERKMEKIILK